MIRVLAPLLFAVGALQLSTSAQCLGVTYYGDFVNIDPITGVGSLLFSTPAIELQDMARASDGRIWCIKRVGIQSPSLYVVDTVLQTAGSFHFTYLNDAMGLAVSPAGTVYANDLVGGAHSRLYTIDVADPNGSTSHLIGDIKIGNQFPSVLDIAFAPGGTLYAWAFSYGLMTIDPITAQAVDVDGQQANTEQIQSIAWSSDGFLYGAYNEFYRIDPSTGATTLIGGPVGFAGVRGIEFFDMSAPAVYCYTKVNSINCWPAIDHSGSSSLTGPDDLTIFASGVLPQKPGLLLTGTLPTNLPFCGGRLCVGGTLHRRSPQLSSNLPVCDSRYTCAFSHAMMASSGLQSGDWIYAQWWSRDTGFPQPNDVGLSDALAVMILP